MAEAGPLADLILLIHQLSDNTPNLRQLLSKLLAREDQLIQTLPELDEVARALTPSSHTLGLIFILYAQPYQPARTCGQTPQDVMACSRLMRLSTSFYSPDA